MHAFSLQQLWINGLLVVPAAAAVWMSCRVLRLRAATRHGLWLLVLALLLLPSLATSIVPSDWARAVIDMAARVDFDQSRLSEFDHATAGSMPGSGPVPATVPSNEPANIEGTPPPAAMLWLPEARPRTHRTTRVDSLPALSSDVGSPFSGLSRSSGQAGLQQSPFRSGAIEHSSSQMRATPVPIDHSTPWFDVNRSEFVAPGSGHVETESSASAAPSETSADSGTEEPVVPASSPERQPRAIASWRAYLNELFASAAALREAFVRLPALPAALWFGGAILIFTILVARLLHVRRLVRAAAPASPDILDIVRRAGRRIDLSSVPETRITTADVPPMVWCVRRPVLILPRRLWSQLDDASRLAVIFHELAHLRRRDHILCWMEMLAAVFFWWNPAVWWVCRQVRDEADACCDAWVVRLQPTGRRAYAQALLASTHMNGTVAFAGPVVGLGALRPRTRRLARRLTMVMTEHLRPGLSLRGLAALTALGAAACLVAPIAACPPEEEAKQKEKELVKAAEAQAEMLTGQVDEAASTYEQFVRNRDSQPAIELYHNALLTYTAAAADDPYAAQDDVNARLDALEARLDHIAALLEHLGMASDGAANHAQGSLQSTQNTIRADASVAGDDVITRTYALPKGKLKELTDLMVLQDVPILVTPRVEEGVIDVHATPAQHEIFSAFLSIIHPEGVKVTGQALQGLKQKITTTSDFKLQSEQLKQKKQQLSAELQAAKQRSSGHETQAMDLEAAIEKLEAELEALEEKSQDTTGEEKKAINEHTKTLKQQMKHFEEALRQQEREMENAEREAEEAEAAIDSIDEDLEELADLADVDDTGGAR